MGKINIVLEGKYKNEKIKAFSNKVYLPNVEGGYFLTPIHINSYNVIDETTKNSTEYSYWRGRLGEFLMDSPSGLLMGKVNRTYKEYLISIEWKDGEKSLIAIDDKFYKSFLIGMF